jgi:hypothetical protein
MVLPCTNNDPVEVTSEELKERGPAGQRVIQPKVIVWNSAPRQEIQMVSERWQGCMEIQLTWTELLALHDDLSRTIDHLKPLIESGKIISK